MSQNAPHRLGPVELARLRGVKEEEEKAGEWGPDGSRRPGGMLQARMRSASAA